MAKILTFWIAVHSIYDMRHIHEDVLQRFLSYFLCSVVHEIMVNISQWVYGVTLNSY